ncbi:MAG TPA: DsbA family oxidoreductase [Candidatus Thermoplasmatota archaeon]
MTETITIDVWSDIVCPWCYVGREHLMHAIRNLGVADSVHVIHHAYQLDPNRPASEPLTAWLSKKFGPEHEHMTARVSQVGKAVGLVLDFSIGIAANTRIGHRLVHLGTRNGLGDAMLERLMRAHFAEGLDIADRETLERLANEVRLPVEEVEGALSERRFDDAVQTDIDVARDLGIRGVPFFVFNRRFALSGAQPIEVFEDALRQAAEPVAPPVADENIEPAA